MKTDGRPAPQLVSVILPAYDEERDLPRCLDSLAKQDYECFEIIAVDDGSTDATAEILRAYAERDSRLRIAPTIPKDPRLGAGAPRNRGATLARGSILVFVDADEELPTDYLERITAPIRRGETVATMYGYEENANFDENLWTRCYGRIRWDAFLEGHEYYPVCSAIEASTFAAIGGFDENRGYGEDHSLHDKSGLVCTIVDVCSRHNNPRSLREIYAQAVWFGRGIPERFARRHIEGRMGDPTLVRQVRIAVAIGIALSLALAGLVPILGWGWPLAGITGLAMLALATTSVSKALHERRAGLLIAYPVFLIVNWAGNLHGLLSHLLTGTVAPARGTTGF